jgi:heme exporter protein CcmB
MHRYANPLRYQRIADAVLLLGTPTLTLIGSIGARRRSARLALVVLPLYVPVLIFGVSAVEGAVMGLGGRPQLLIFSAMLFAALALAPSPPPPRRIVRALNVRVSGLEV